MTDDTPQDITAPGQDGTRSETTTGTTADTADHVTYSMSGGLVSFLAAQNISITVSSYQSGKFYLLGRNPAGGLMVNEHFFQKAMGICVQDNAIYLAALFQILRLENVLAPGLQVNETFDACYVPRQTYVTGVLDAHDIGVTTGGGIIFVNTRFNCLATLSDVHSFKPVWKPPFISKIIDEDRCHLNGMAMRDGKPAYVTAVSRSDTIDGWRDRRANGGIVMDVESGKVICEGLSMPHSPRMHNGKLWLLNSGTGELGWVDMEEKDPAKAFRPLVFCPGFARGLAFHGNHALVGLSKPRHERFEGLALDDRLQAADSDAWCGIQIIDLTSGTCVQWFRIDGAVSELYDIGVVPGAACPMSLGLATDEILSFITHEDLPSAEA